MYESNEPTYVYDGWSLYGFMEHDDGDSQKVGWFAVRDRTKETVRMDWSPYVGPSQEDFELWVRVGMPGRLDGHPLRREQLKVLETPTMTFTSVSNRDKIRLTE